MTLLNIINQNESFLYIFKATKQLYFQSVQNENKKGVLIVLEQIKSIRDI